MRRLTVETGILSRRAASEKLFASTTVAKIASEFRSIIIFPIMEISFPALQSNGHRQLRILFNQRETTTGERK
jgi:hypothetical protein